MNTKRQIEIIEAIRYILEEAIADFLDKDNVIMHQAMLGIKDPALREETELHIRMANAALKEYEKTMYPTI